MGRVPVDRSHRKMPALSLADADAVDASDDLEIVTRSDAQDDLDQECDESSDSDEDAA